MAFFDLTSLSLAFIVYAEKIVQEIYYWRIVQRRGVKTEAVGGENNLITSDYHSD